MLKRNISAATGVRASDRPGQQPGRRPEPAAHAWRTAAPTVATPISAWGTSMLQELTPKSRTDSPITHSEAGGLSTVMELAASDEPKKKAFQLWLAAWAAAE